MIRQAQKEDKNKAAVLMYDAIHDIANALTGESSKEKVLEQLERYFCEENNRLSYRNCLVRTVGQQPAGLVVAYHGRDAKALDEPIIRHLSQLNGRKPELDQEADEADYYIDTVSVSPDFRGLGYGTELIQAAIHLAKEKGYSSVSLNVEEHNAAARKLYMKLGFSYKKDIVINHHNYAYMVTQV